MIGTGSMTDPYLPLEAELRLPRRAMEVVERYGCGFTVITKSDLILRDLDLLSRIQQNAKCVVQLTLTTADETLCRKLEPNVCTTARRCEVLRELQKAGIPTVGWLSPILPFINDTEENISTLLDRCEEAGVRGILCFGMGLTLREGNRERYSDDGEPAKTAGTPALEVLQHSGLTDLIVVVTRYFGGVLLGTGGLVRAYTTATARALEAAEVVTVRSVVELSVTVDYSLYERASLLIDAAGAKQAAPQFTDRVTLCWQMPEHTEGPLLEQLRELTRGGAEAAVSEPFYAPF